MELERDTPLMSGCRWVEAPAEGGGRPIEQWSIDEELGFETPRLFWLTDIAPGQWRGRHAHRESILATFCVSGRCRITLDDARRKQVVTLDDNGPGLIVGPWIWHELDHFSPDAVVLVVASTRYTEAEYIRNYETFLREAAAR